MEINKVSNYEILIGYKQGLEEGIKMLEMLTNKLNIYGLCESDFNEAQHSLLNRITDVETRLETVIDNMERSRLND